jgi:hypothetical protein
MEFLRFGSAIPGSYWGTCAIDIVQDFNQDPDAPMSSQVVHGDSGGALTDKDGNALYIGGTYRQIFEDRLRIGTFYKTELPVHTFLASMTSSQIGTTSGKKWLKILKDNGFEFIRAVGNSVYAGANHNVVYVFGLFRNTGVGAVSRPYKPPKAWEDLPDGIPGVYDLVPDGKLKDLARRQLDVYDSLWAKGGAVVYSTEADLRQKGIPVMASGTAGKRPYPIDVKTPEPTIPIR